MHPKAVGTFSVSIWLAVVVVLLGHWAMITALCLGAVLAGHCSSSVGFRVNCLEASCALDHCQDEPLRFHSEEICQAIYAQADITGDLTVPAAQRVSNHSLGEADIVLIVPE